LSARSVGLADVDQDNLLDAVIQDLSSQDQVNTYSLVGQMRPFSSGTRSKLDQSLLPQTIDRPLPLLGNQSWQAFGEIDGNKQTDAVFMSTHGLTVVYNLGLDGSRSIDLPHPSHNDYRLSSIALQDVDKDGDLDVIAVAPELGVVYLYENETIIRMSTEILRL